MARGSFVSMVVVVAAIAAGCGSGGFSSGVDPDKPFNTLTTEEAATACRSLGDYLERQVPASRQAEIACTIDALGSTVTPESCRSAVTTCLAGEPTRIFSMIDCSSPAVSADCAAPVGDVEDCVEADVNVFVGRLDMVSCDAAGDAEALARLQVVPPVPAQCSALAPTCEELSDGLIGR
jgi:hypothetical protein